MTAPAGQAATVRRIPAGRERPESQSGLRPYVRGVAGGKRGTEV
jgi:hypothetical protein